MGSFMPTLQYSKEKIWIEVLGIKDIENLNDDKQIEECFAVEVECRGFCKIKENFDGKEESEDEESKVFLV